VLRVQLEHERHGWNKSQLARRAKIDLSNYSRIESGFRGAFKPELRRLSQVLGVPADELLKEVDTRDGPPAAG